MILGIGVDLLNAKRIEKLYKKFDIKFAKKILSDYELEKFYSEKNKILYLAKRFCVKEAFSKALGLGIGRGVNFIDITTKNDKLGKPFIEITEKATVFIEKHFNKNFNTIKIDLSISDEGEFVTSFIIISDKTN